jgi:hypothetical protein
LACRFHQQIGAFSAALMIHCRKRVFDFFKALQKERKISAAAVFLAFFSAASPKRAGRVDNLEEGFDEI